MIIRCPFATYTWLVSVFVSMHCREQNKYYRITIRVTNATRGGDWLGMLTVVWHNRRLAAGVAGGRAAIRMPCPISHMENYLHCSASSNLAAFEDLWRLLGGSADAVARLHTHAGQKLSWSVSAGVAKAAALICSGD